jgi:DNA repair exonuclease SbcCD nuclease subunit
VKELAKINKVDLILCGGDLFHTAVGSHSLLTDLMTWLKSLPCSFYSVQGNHDIHAFQLTDTNNALNVLFESGLVEKLDEVVFEKDKVLIRGIPAYLNPKEGNYIFEEKWKDYYKIIVSHNYISKVPQIFDCYLTKDIVTNANLVLSGHLHQGFSDIQGNTQFINPSSIARWASNETHQPQILILDTNTRQIKRIELGCSKKAEYIFDIESIREIKSTEMNLQNFVQSLEGASFENVDIENVVLTKGKEQGILKEILDICLDKVSKAKEELR